MANHIKTVDMVKIFISKKICTQVSALPTLHSGLNLRDLKENYPAMIFKSEHNCYTNTLIISESSDLKYHILH